MSNYVKATNFAVKDGLSTGNPAKIIKGTEIDTEFNSVASAISSKADSDSPTLTGTPLTPTASAGTSTTQIASTAFVGTAITNERAATATLTNKTLTSPVLTGANATITSGSISGITDLAVADGGTGASSITANSVILGNGSSALSGNLVAPGFSGNVLQSNGTTWAATPLSSLATGVKQVQSATKTDVFTTTTASTWFDITGLSASITPSSASSKILVLVSLTVGSDGHNATARLVRGSTAIAIGNSSGSRTPSSVGDYYDNASVSRTYSIMYVDSPSTTSSTTYKIQGFQDIAGTYTVNASYNDVDATYTFRSVSSIILLEILT
jgi:hypothetical protein